MRIPYCTPYEYRSYDELLIEVQKFSAGLVKTGPGLKDGNSKLAIFASTRPEWQIAAQAAFLRGITIVTMYPSLGADALQFSLHQTEVTHVVTQASLIETILKAADRLPVLSSIIYFDEIKSEKLSEYQSKYPNISFNSYSQVLIDGADKKPSSYIPTENDLAVIMYTSGSTGNPKGVMISHKNVLALINAAAFGIPNPITEKDVIIAYLPLAHILELAAESGVMAAGGCVGYSSPFTLRDDQVRDADGNPAGDLSTLRPTLMAAVPLILDRIRSAISDKVNKSSPIMRIVFNSAFHLKKRAWLLGETTPLLDKIVFKKIAKQFGGRLRYILSGGAPLSKDTQLFINVCFCATILQGYGLTETSAGGCISHPDDRILGVVGPPKACTKIKLVDIPDMGYTAADKPYPRGEIWISGPNVTLGYFKMPEKTAEDFKEEKDGSRWFATGDVGQWLSDGNLQIIDRKKDLVKLIHGEYIALGKCESVYLHSSLIENICVYGDADHDRPIALVVPNLINLGKAAIAAGVPESDTHDLKSLVRHPKVYHIVIHSLAEQAKKNHLEKWEHLGAIHLCDESWTPESGLLTEAMKLKRHEITRRFKAELEKAYAAI